MNEVQRLATQGFKLPGDTDIQLAFLSLRIALKGYFSTYKACKGDFDPVEPKLDESMEENILYYEAYAETIVHFQHFFELIIKHILRGDHALLASRISSDPIILHKILHGEHLTSDEDNNLQSIEFSDALKTICSLLKDNQLRDSHRFKYIVDNRSSLEELNRLRNRVWHRGAYFLSYTTLDQFVGRYVLPIVKLTLELPLYASVKTWKYKSVHCSLDPIDTIIAGYDASKIPSSGKIALLKEMGRAAYSNPLIDKSTIIKRMNERIVKIEKEIAELETRGEEIPKRLLISKGATDISYRVANQIDAPYIEKARKIAEHEAEKEFFKIKLCPVCGVKSLVLYEESDFYEDAETGKDIQFNWIDKVRCECCSFEIDHKLEIGKYDLGIEDYWNPD